MKLTNNTSIKMTIVMSKLKQFGDHYNIPHNYVTRTVSGAIFAVYFYKIGLPVLQTALNEIKARARVAQDKITGCESRDSVAEKDPGDGFISDIGKVQDESKKRKRDDEYLNFGPRTGGYQDFIVDTLVSALLTFQKVTGFNVSFIIQLIKIIRIMVSGSNLLSTCT